MSFSNTYLSGVIQMLGARLKISAGTLIFINSEPEFNRFGTSFDHVLGAV